MTDYIHGAEKKRRRIDSRAKTQEPYFAQIRKLISMVMHGSHKSRNVANMERMSFTGGWLGPEFAVPHTIGSDDALGGGLQEGSGQATTDGGTGGGAPPITTGSG